MGLIVISQLRNVIQIFGLTQAKDIVSELGRRYRHRASLVSLRPEGKCTKKAGGTDFGMRDL